MLHLPSGPKRHANRAVNYRLGQGHEEASMKPSRVRWDELPDSVHYRVAEILGSPVSVDNVQTQGTTPGVASRVVTADGLSLIHISEPTRQVR